MQIKTLAEDDDDLRRYVCNERKCHRISLADSNYFQLLNELVDSIKQFKESAIILLFVSWMLD